MAGWSVAELPELSGRTVVVTGASSGIGFETASALAGAGAEVTLAVRDLHKGDARVERIRALHPHANVRAERLDLADLESVAEFCGLQAQSAVDVLVNNAGIMAVPFATTRDGFESQVGTNHLGHFSLTAGLLPALLRSSSPRVVTVTSLVHRRGTLRSGDRAELDTRPPEYRAWKAYSNSKLANLLFTLELDRLARDNGTPLLSLAAHPGYAATGLQQGPGLVGGVRGRATDLAMNIGNRFAQSAAAGALPSLFAAGMPDVEGGQFYGPSGIFEGRGSPRLVSPSRQAADPELARRVWRTSEELTGARFEALR